MEIRWKFVCSDLNEKGKSIEILEEYYEQYIDE